MNQDLRVKIMTARCVKTGLEAEKRQIPQTCIIVGGSISNAVRNVKNAKQMFEERIAAGEPFDEDLWERYLELYKYLEEENC